MKNQVNIQATQESVQEFFNGMRSLEVPKKKIINSLMKQYEINIREARALYQASLPKRKRHRSK